MVKIQSLAGIDVLLLTAGYGGGHIQAAQALGNAFSVLYPNLRAETINFMKQMLGPSLDRSIHLTYITLVKHTPSLYRNFYRLTDKSSFSPFWQRRMNRLGFTRMGRYLRVNPPRLVVALYPIPAGVVSELKRKGLHNVPLATVITDHVAHGQWIHPHTDLYLVGSDPVKRELVERDIPQERIEVTGIPIDPAFGRKGNKHSLRRELGLEEDLFTVLILGGFFGHWGGMKEICTRLARFPLPIQVVVITGKDFKMKEKLGPIAIKSRHPIHIQGFVDAMPPWMAVADVLISKAGGITISEAMASELPILIYQPIPGQEEANVRYLVQEGAAKAANTIPQLTLWLEQLIQNPTEIEEMHQAANRIARADSALVAARLLYERFLTGKQDKDSA